jgi:glycosyltransferase involved in cell wall biosynthesis
MVTHWKCIFDMKLQTRSNQTLSSSPTLKLALVTETFPPEINGVSMTLGRLANILSEKGVEVSIIAPQRENRALGHLPYSIIQVPGFPIPKYPELLFGWPAFQTLRREWMRQPPTLVHVATEGPLGWSATVVANSLDIPVISSFHTNFHTYTRHYGFGYLNGLLLSCLRSFHNRTLRTFVPSSDVLMDLERNGFQHLRLLARGVDTDLFSPLKRSNELRQTWDAGSQTPVLLYTGRLAAEKNLQLLVTAFQKIRSVLPHAKMVFVGDGPFRPTLENLLPDAVFAGMRTGEDLAACYASCDAFLFPSTSETFGNVVTEAMASGLPVLAFDYAAPKRFIQHGSNGLLAPLGNDSAFLALADWLAQNTRLWQKIGSAARDTVLPHSWTTVADTYLNEIQSLQMQMS